MFMKTVIFTVMKNRQITKVLWVIKVMYLYCYKAVVYLSQNLVIYKSALSDSARKI